MIDLEFMEANGRRRAAVAWRDMPLGRTDLSEQQWRRLSVHLPPNPRRGHAYVDHREVINGIIWRLKTGAPWRDVPTRYDPWQTCYDRFVRWSRDGTWHRLLSAGPPRPNDLIDWKGAALDATHVKAHRVASGARKTVLPAEKRGHKR